MRLAGQAKLGYFPASPLGIAELVKHLHCRPINPGKPQNAINILDPCAGKGVAIRDIAVALGVPEERVYTVELDGGRSEDIKALMPRSQHLGPAGFHGVQITGGSFGLVYCNPPFDDELGGGKREEMGFTEVATRKLVPRGVLVLVCPIKALAGNGDFVRYIDANYEDVAVYKFPDGYAEDGAPIRGYNEIVVIGTKRAAMIPRDAVETFGCLHRMRMQWHGYVTIDSLPALGQTLPARFTSGRPGDEREPVLRTWEVPHSGKPHVFKKTMFTEAELEAVISGSPLNGVLDEVVIPPPDAPPLPLDKGHLGLILASGMLDGVVRGPHGAHVVRGSSHKVEYHNKEMSTNEVNPDSGAVTTRDVFSQRMVTVIRVVEQDGSISTYSNLPDETDLDDQGCDD